MEYESKPTTKQNRKNRQNVRGSFIDIGMVSGNHNGVICLKNDVALKITPGNDLKVIHF